MFKNGTPSRRCTEAFVIRRPDLRKMFMRFVEDRRLSAISHSSVAEHTALVTAILQRYRITDPSRVVNLDEIGFSFDRMTQRSLRRGVTHATHTTAVAIPAIRTSGNLNHVTMMVVVSSNGKAFKPLLVLPGKQPNFRRLSSGRTQTVHDFLPPCYVFQRNPAGVDSSIFLE